MSNRDTSSAQEYHERTKHTQVSIRSGPHYLDWDNQPKPFKVYDSIDTLPLDEHLSSTKIPTFQALSRPVRAGETTVTRQELSELLFLCAGVTRRRRYSGGEMLFRAAACTGALYHIDAYVVAGSLGDLDAGVYHFAPERFALTPLRVGDYRGLLVDAVAGESAVAQAPATLVFASTFWRNSWKYRDRTYRHCFWDSGTILANCLAAAAARDIPARIVLGFADGPVNHLLGLETGKEAALCLVPIGRTLTTVPSCGVLPTLKLTTQSLSPREVDYPSIREMHSASCLESGVDTRSWRDARPAGLDIGEFETVAAEAPTAGITDGENDGVRVAEGLAVHELPLAVEGASSLPVDSVEEVILRRGSTRRFSREAITFAQLSNALYYATQGVAMDVDPEGAQLFSQLYLIVNNVDAVTPGTYVFDRDRACLDLLQDGDFRREAGALGLGQEIPRDASVNVYFMTDLKPLLQRFGNRGYRLAQMEASVSAGRLYLAAYAQGFGASGLTFFDDDVTMFFSPHAAGKSVMFLIALGRRLKSK